MAPISKRSLLLAAAIAAAFVCGAAWAVLKPWPYREFRAAVLELRRPAHPPVAQRSIVTDVAILEVETLDIATWEPIARPGGGIDAIGNDVLVMSFRGEFFLLPGARPERPVVRLGITLDNGYDRYREYLVTNGLEFPNADTHFRFIDVVYDDTDVAPALWVSHHQWHDDDRCYTLGLSKLTLRADVPLARQSATSDDWRRVYETVPCLPLDAATPVMEGHRSGGRMVVLGPDAVLLSVGDHGFDGWGFPELAQDAASDYGKILLLEPGSGRVRHYSSGHRNPQGLTISRDHLVWSTEHGPRGGDELNLISEGFNYGWPYTTYGAQYGMSSWPVAATQNRHDGYVKPAYAWLPSIGVSGLIQVRGFLPQWDGDLLIASLKGRALHRVRYSEGRVVFDEPIPVGEWIRDIDQLEDGTIVLWTNAGRILELRPGAEAGPGFEQVVARFPAEQRRQVLGVIGACLQCHAAAAGEVSAAAPNLWGVYGRGIAVTDFDGYSVALKARSGSWDDATLDAFLADVQRFAQGSTMAFTGIPDPEVRAAIIDYLKGLRAGVTGT